ncbi:YegS/Rv2252/BmrU family lipid kinase [Bacillus aerolatus]|uniref:YegS/Rv2252/BmrU family lipid kinase n=1 Tax=Bacillus aerolatus TaxID=2653354 RepID=A0A6I1FH42_9BACI|nr:YegS/Rv2252/BmrU family lipid kinase [Bacillus aerolatus]
MRKSMIVVNPASGKEEAEVYVEKVQQQLRKMEYETDVRFTEKGGDATAFAEEACANKYDLVISIGGDGTLNETINGLAEKGHRPVLGIVPLGTVNDFARALNIPLEAEEAITAIGTGKLKKVDIGKINYRYFLNIAALGDIAESTADVSSGQKTALGSLAYFLEGAKTLVNKKSFDLRIRTNDNQYEEEALLFLAALTNSVGGFEKMAPEAEVNDGKLHCFIIKDTAFPRLVRIAANLLKGELKADPDVLYFRANQLTVSSSQPLKANVDGDAGEKVPLTLQVLKEHIDVMVP